jgi:hypothetical protein
VKPAGHTQLPYSLLKTPPFVQLRFEDAKGKINCYETIKGSSDTTKITYNANNFFSLEQRCELKQYIKNQVDKINSLLHNSSHNEFCLLLKINIL